MAKITRKGFDNFDKFGEEHEKENNLREKREEKKCGIEIFQGGLGGTPQKERDS